MAKIDNLNINLVEDDNISLVEDEDTSLVEDLNLDEDISLVEDEEGIGNEEISLIEDSEFNLEKEQSNLNESEISLIDSDVDLVGKLNLGDVYSPINLIDEDTLGFDEVTLDPEVEGIDLLEDDEIDLDIGLDISSETDEERQLRLEQERIEAEEIEHFKQYSQERDYNRASITPLMSVQKISGIIDWIKYTLRPYGQDAIDFSTANLDLYDPSIKRAEGVSLLGDALYSLVEYFVESVLETHGKDNIIPDDIINLDFIEILDLEFLTLYTQVLADLNLNSLDELMEIKQTPEAKLVLKNCEPIFDGSITLCTQMNCFIHLCTENSKNPKVYFQHINHPYPTLASLPLPLGVSIKVREIIASMIKDYMKLETVKVEKERQLLNLIKQKSKMLELESCNKYVYVDKVYNDTFVCGDCGKTSKTKKPFFSMFLSSNLKDNSLSINNNQTSIISFVNKCENCGSGNLISYVESLKLYESFLKNNLHSEAYGSFNEFLGKLNSKGNYGLYVPPFDFLAKVQPVTFTITEEQEMKVEQESVEDIDEMFRKASENYLKMLSYFESTIDESTEEVSESAKAWIVTEDVKIKNEDEIHKLTMEDSGVIYEFSDSLLSVCNNLKVSRKVIENSRNTATMIALLCNKEYNKLYKDAYYSLIKFIYTETKSGEYMDFISLCQVKSRTVYNIDKLEEYIQYLEKHDQYDRVMIRIWDVLDVRHRYAKAYGEDELGNVFLLKHGKEIQTRNRRLAIETARNAKDKEKKFLEIRNSLLRIIDYSYLFSYIIIEEESRRSLKLDSTYLTYNPIFKNFLEFTSNIIIIRSLSDEFFEYFTQAEFAKPALRGEDKNNAQEGNMISEARMMSDRAIKDIIAGNTKDTSATIIKLCSSCLNSYYKLATQQDSVFFKEIGSVVKNMLIPNMNRFFLYLGKISSAYKNNDEFSFCKNVVKAESLLYLIVGITVKEVVTEGNVKRIIKEQCEPMGYPFKAFKFLVDIIEDCKDFCRLHAKSKNEYDYVYYYFKDKFSKEEILEYLENGRISLGVIDKIPERLDGESFSEYYQRYTQINQKGYSGDWSYTTHKSELLTGLLKYSLELDCMDLPYKYTRLHTGNFNDNVYSSVLFNILFFALFCEEDCLDLILHADIRLFTNNINNQNKSKEIVNNDNVYEELAKEVFVNNLIFGLPDTDLLYSDFAADASRQLSKNTLLEDSNLTVQDVFESSLDTLKELTSEEFYNSLFDIKNK